MDSIRIKMENFESLVCFSNYKEVFEAQENYKKIFICDSNTARFIPEDFIDQTVIIKAGEKYKNWESVNLILEHALNHEIARDDYFIGIGGGVITDMAAFAASIYMRGCNLILVPSTVLAMVDAAIGGKTGMDFYKYKNLIGSFYPAEKIIIDLALLNSLNQKEYVSGLAEIIKAGFLAGNKLYELLVEFKDDILNRNSEILKKIIYLAVGVKTQIVEKDLKE